MNNKINVNRLMRLTGIKLETLQIVLGDDTITTGSSIIVAPKEDKPMEDLSIEELIILRNKVHEQAHNKLKELQNSLDTLPYVDDLPF